MNIDRRFCDQLSGMDPRELEDKISAVSKLMGVDAGYIKNLIGSPADMQKKLNGLSEKDIKRISSGLDPELIKKLMSGGGDNGK